MLLFAKHTQPTSGVIRHSSFVIHSCRSAERPPTAGPLRLTDPEPVTGRSSITQPCHQTQRHGNLCFGDQAPTTFVTVGDGAASPPAFAATMYTEIVLPGVRSFSV